MKTVQPLQKKRIFVFDRNAAFLDALSIFFKGKHEMYGFSSFSEIDAMHTIKPDVIIVDILPTTRTHELVKIVDMIKKVYKKIPILIMSTNKRVFQQARRIGLKHYLEKPFDTEIFQQKISTIAK